MKVKEVLEYLNSLSDEEKELDIVTSDNYLAMFGKIHGLDKFVGTYSTKILIKSSCK
jgi:hypothetical protein